MIKDTNIFVISHKTDELIDKFDKIITFQKIKGFSKMTAWLFFLFVLVFLSSLILDYEMEVQWGTNSKRY